MQNHVYFFVNMHTAKIYTKNYANGKSLQVDTTRRSHPPTANCAYQQLSSIAHLLLARTRPVRRPYHARTQFAHYRPVLPAYNSEQLILYACRKSKSVL